MENFPLLEMNLCCCCCCSLCNVHVQVDSSRLLFGPGQWICCVSSSFPKVNANIYVQKTHTHGKNSRQNIKRARISFTAPATKHSQCKSNSTWVKRKTMFCCFLFFDRIAKKVAAFTYKENKTRITLDKRIFLFLRALSEFLFSFFFLHRTQKRYIALRQFLELVCEAHDLLRIHRFLVLLFFYVIYFFSLFSAWISYGCGLYLSSRASRAKKTHETSRNEWKWIESICVFKWNWWFLSKRRCMDKYIMRSFFRARVY